MNDYDAAANAYREIEMLEDRQRILDSINPL